MVTIAHLTVTVLLYESLDKYVEQSLPIKHNAADVEEATISTTVITLMSFLCFAVDLLGFFSGATLFSPFVCAFDVFVHALGTIYLSWAMIEAWGPDMLYTQVILCCFLPATLEVFALLQIYACRIVRY